MNKYATDAVQSTNTERAQQKQRSSGSTNSPSTPTALLSPTKSSTNSGSKSIKRRKIRGTVADSERERAAQKFKREEGAEEEEDSESYETPDKYSDSATTEKTKTKTKNDKVTLAEGKLLKTKFTSKGPALFGSVQNLKNESKTSQNKDKQFRHTEPAYTKYRIVRCKTLRLKVIVYDIDKIWSIDQAYVDTTKTLNILWLQWIACRAIYVYKP